MPISKTLLHSEMPISLARKGFPKVGRKTRKTRRLRRTRKTRRLRRTRRRKRRRRRRSTRKTGSLVKRLKEVNPRTNLPKLLSMNLWSKRISPRSVRICLNLLYRSHLMRSLIR